MKPALHAYIANLRAIAKDGTYAHDEGSINLPFDRDLLEATTRVWNEKKAKRLKYVFVVGIGGSNLGTKAVYDACCGFFDILEPRRFPKLLFLDTTHAAFADRLESFVKKNIAHPDELLVNVISKSGSTMETAANADLLITRLKRRWKNIDDRLVYTTDIGSELWRHAEQQGIAVLPIPKRVGGRYSVFSPVGLFPLMAAGMDVAAFLDGARRMREKCLTTTASNPALASALAIHREMKRGAAAWNLFFFNPELESLGKWVRQLVGESLGKNGKGILPTVSIGSTDLHSVGQLYLGGPNNLFTTFVRADQGGDSASTKRLATILRAIYRGVTAAYKKRKRPFTEVLLDSVSERSLGGFMQQHMIETMLLAKLLGVNAFDQPAVELYKTETKRLLR